MKNLILTAVILIMVSACGKEMPDAACENGQGHGVKAKCNGTTDIPFSQATIKSDGSTIGYILGFEEGWALVYLKEEKKYVEMDIQSGDYRVYPTARSSVIYFSGRNCSGNSIIETFNGEVGKTVIYTRDNRYFLVGGLSSYKTTKFKALSQLSLTRGSVYTPDSDICQDLGDKGQDFDRIAGTLTETSQPYNFASKAPLTVEYEVDSTNKKGKK